MNISYENFGRIFKFKNIPPKTEERPRVQGRARFSGLICQTCVYPFADFVVQLPRVTPTTHAKPCLSTLLLALLSTLPRFTTRTVAWLHPTRTYRRSFARPLLDFSVPRLSRVSYRATATLSIVRPFKSAHLPWRSYLFVR